MKQDRPIAVGYEGAPPPASNGEIRYRELNKRDKRRRIQSAARALFSKAGFEDTTLREIARKAGVALGTLSLYADDKRDLVLLIFSEEIAALIERAAKAPRKNQDLADQLAAFFGEFYKEYAREPVLYRTLLRENLFYGRSTHSAGFKENVRRIIGCIEALVAAQQKAGKIPASVDPTLVGRHFFFVFFAAVRWWITDDKPQAKDGIAELKRLFRMTVSGLMPQPGPRGRRA
jgi:AcrR family transcriptional regulator